MLNQLILFVNKHENISEYSSQTLKTSFLQCFQLYSLILIWIENSLDIISTLVWWPWHQENPRGQKTLSYITQCQKPTNSHIVLPRHNLSSLYLHQSPSWVLTFQFGRKLASDKTALQGTLCRPWRWMFCDDWFHEFFRK